MVLPTASGMRKLYPSRVWWSREGMMPFKPIGLQSDSKGVILTKRGLWLDLRHKEHHKKQKQALKRHGDRRSNLKMYPSLQTVAVDRAYKQDA